eukprot:11802345-Alexandrium_andersonii.AAC.1
MAAGLRFWDSPAACQVGAPKWISRSGPRVGSALSEESPASPTLLYPGLHCFPLTRLPEAARTTAQRCRRLF